MLRNSVEIQVRFRDIDAYGHVNNAVYLSYLEVARIELIHDVFMQDMERNIQYLLIESNIKYIRPILLSNRLLVNSWISDIGKVRFRVDYELHNGEGVMYSNAYTYHALYNANTNHPVRITEEWKDAILGLQR